MNKLRREPFNLKSFLVSNAIIFILIGLAVVATINNINFIMPANLRNMGNNIGPRFLIALGVSGCLITRGTDLTAGRMVGLGACISGILLQRMDYSSKFFPNLGDVPIVLALLITMVCCGVFGCVNGFVIAKLKVPPFISSLGIQTVVYGICLILTDAVPLGGYRTAYTNIATLRPLGIPMVVYIAVAMGLVFWFLYNKTRHGKYMYAIGGNENAAEVSGVNVSRSLIKIYTLAAMMYAFAGFLVGAKSGGANVNTGFGYELEAIASCTIGGVSTSGGVGRVTGILVGVMVFEILKSSMQFLGVNTSYQYIVQGIVIITAVALDLRKYLAKK